MKLLILVTLLGFALAQDRCRRISDDCRDACLNVSRDSCPRYFTYTCPEQEQSRCICRLYNNVTKRRILNPRRDCFEGIERCRDKECDEDSDCREETSYCTERDMTKCRFHRKVEAKCVKQTCASFDCERGKECRMVARRDGRRRPRCVYSEPRDCNETICDYTDICEMREIRDRDRTRRRPRCRPATFEERCRMLNCREDMECRNVSREIVCVRRDCRSMRCDRGYQCREVRKGGERRARCVRDAIRESYCDELRCEDGFMCRMRNRTEERVFRLRPVCVPAQCPVRREVRPPRTCSEIRCREDEDCISCRSENRDRLARCQRRDDREDDRLRDARGERPRNCTERRCTNRRPPQNCAEVKCWDDERCSIFEHNGVFVASCISERSVKNCSRRRCEGDDECRVLQNADGVRLAYCLRELRTVVNRTRRAERCEELRCEDHSTCFRSREDGRWRARCRRNRRERMPSCRNDVRGVFLWRRFRERRCEDREQRPTINSRALLRTDVTERRESRRQEDRRTEERRCDRDNEELELPDQCLELECCREERCVEDITDDGRVIARCRPVNETDGLWERPLRCDEVECEEGFTCREERERREDREARRERETREDREQDSRRRSEDRRRDEDRRREDREREDRRTTDNRRRRDERIRFDRELTCRRCCEDRRCGVDKECCRDGECCRCEDDRNEEDDEEKESRSDDPRCRDLSRERIRDDREMDERRRREDRDREDERRRQNRERDEARRCEDREREDRRRREDRERDERRREERRRRAARCVPEEFC